MTDEKIIDRGCAFANNSRLCTGCVVCDFALDVGQEWFCSDGCLGRYMSTVGGEVELVRESLATALAERDAAREEVERLKKRASYFDDLYQAERSVSRERLAEVARLKTEVEAVGVVVAACEALRSASREAKADHWHDKEIFDALDAYRRTRPSGEGERR